jgi:hypothetical protein
MLDHLPGAGDDLERLGDVFAQLRETRAATAGAGRGRRVQDALPRQMRGEWLAGGLPAGEAGDVGGLLGGHLGEEIILAGAGLDLFELQLELVDEADGALGGRAVLIALQPGDLELEMGDDRITIRELCLDGGGFRALLQHKGLERFDIVRKICFALSHVEQGITKDAP